MTQAALTAELQALESRKAEIEQQLADMGAGLLKEPKGIERFPILSPREAKADLPFGCVRDPATKSAHGLAHHRLECNCDVCYPAIPATLAEESHSE